MLLCTPGNIVDLGISRRSHRHIHQGQSAVQGMLLHTLGTVGGAATGVICYAMLLIIRVRPWWHAQYFIPTLGMLLGNCISGVSVGLSAIMEELTTGKSEQLQT